MNEHDDRENKMVLADFSNYKFDQPQQEEQSLAFSQEEDKDIVAEQSSKTTLSAKLKKSRQCHLCFTSEGKDQGYHNEKK